MEGAMTELEHGDGAWENIQEVLRREFVKLWAAIAVKKSRGAKTEKRLRELERALADKVDCKSFCQQQAQVEAAVRSVGLLNEDSCRREAQIYESKQHPSAQLQAYLDTLRDDFQRQILDIEASLTARVTEVQDSYNTLLLKVERRLELLEEELSILVTAIDKKADVASVNSSLLEQKRALKEAIRKRCKKSAFDNEVLAVHDLLRHQQSTIETQLEGALVEAKSSTEAHFQHEIRDFAEHHEEKLVQLKQEIEERSSQLISRQTELVLQVELKLSQRIDEELYNNAVVTASNSTETKVWLRDEFTQMRHIQETILRAEQDAVNQRVKEDLEYQLLVWKKSVSKDRMELLDDGKVQLEVINELRRDNNSLKTVVGALQTELSGASTALHSLAQHLQNHSQAKTQELSEEITRTLQTMETSKRAREKKLRQQLDAFGEKLGELDQIVKLVGKQLIQNTSQLQLFRKEQHVRRQLHMAEELEHFTHENLLLGASEEFDDDEEQFSKAVQPLFSNNSSAVPVDSDVGKNDNQPDESMVQLRSQHETLRHAICDKLRHYQELLQQE